MTYAPRTNDRVLLGEFDSQHQRETLAGEKWVDTIFDRENPVLRQGLGALRLEVLLSQKVVITDAQAYDGRVLMGLAATGLLDDLSTDSQRPLPLELRSRSHDPSQVRAEILGKATGSVSSFFTESEDLADGIVDQLRGRQPIQPQQLLPMLRAAGARDQELAAAEQGWAALDAMSRGGALPPVLWERRDWAQCQSWADRAVPLAALAASLELSDEQRDMATELSRLSVRSDFRRGLAAQGWAPEATLALNGWYDDRYNRATAFYQGADFRTFRTGPLGAFYRTASEGDTPQLRRTTLDLPAGFIEGLGRLTLDEWKRAHAAAQPHLNGWWARSRTSDLERALDIVARECRTVSTDQTNGPARFISLGIAAIADVAMLPLNFDPVGIFGVLLVNVLAGGITALGRSPVVLVTDEYDDHRGAVV